MTAAEENWQTKLATLVERTTFIFNNELLSDVKFVVPVSTGESESKKVIPAHKFVLAISSPVFFAMFYGQMAETKDSIELPDCEYESLLELFRFLYSDKVNLSGSNVMQVLYLANKYMVSSLTEKCTEYLRDNLTASNVFSILPHAQKFDKDLEDQCWQVVEMQTEEAVTSDEFVTVERSLVESVVKREVLSVTEVELFKAVDRWVRKECERQGITADGEAKRRILGEDIVKAIRFPLMSQKEFASVVFDSHVLTFEEFGTMIKYYNDMLTIRVPFLKVPRIGCGKNRCNRFKKFLPPDSSWYYTRELPDNVQFSVNMLITLCGIQHFGSDGGKYKVSTEVKHTTQDSSVVKRSGTYTSKKDENNNYYGFDVLFNRAVCLEAYKQYKLVSLINGPVSWYGEEGQTTVKSGGVRFTFSSSNESSNGTSVTRGQFPAFIFC